MIFVLFSFIKFSLVRFWNSWAFTKLLKKIISFDALVIRNFGKTIKPRNKPDFRYLHVKLFLFCLSAGDILNLNMVLREFKEQLFWILNNTLNIIFTSYTFQTFRKEKSRRLRLKIFVILELLYLLSIFTVKLLYTVIKHSFNLNKFYDNAKLRTEAILIKILISRSWDMNFRKFLRNRLQFRN